MLKRVLPLAFAAIFSAASTASAQAPTLGRAPAGIGEILGKLVDSASGRAVASGSVTVRRAGDSTFAGGALPKPDGSFRVDGLIPGRYTLRVRAIGFAQVLRPDIVISSAKAVVDVGTIKLNGVVAKLEGQEVVAEREETILAPDRNSYSTKNMTVASGGTAVDVLRNIPLVEVDGSNNVSLRGNANVVVQINGRSTPLKGDQLGTFLAQLPAGTVKNVEVATNPSAKNDPEGTAGIINIVLNQEAELGLSGGVSAGTSTTGQVNASGNVGKQQGPLTVFLSANVYRDRRSTYGTISRENLVVPVPVFVETALQGKQRPLSGGGTLRSEYKFTKTDGLSFDGFIFGGHFGGNQASDYTDLDASRVVIGLFNQFNEQSSRHFLQDYDFTFRHQGAPSTPQFTTELEYSTNVNHNDTNLSGELLMSDASTPASIPQERDIGVSHNPYLNLKIDYTHPFGSTTKLETGLKGVRRTVSNDFEAAYLNAFSGVYEPVAARTTALDYQEEIGSGYAVVSRQIGKFQTQGGLRLEDAVTQLNLRTTVQRFDNRYTSVYPSAIVSYNFTEMRQAKISYSRRVSRPNPYQLNPTENRQDTRNVFRGNPSLRAEYTNAMELGFQEARSWGSIQVSPYLRHTSNAVRNIQFVDSMGVSVSTFANLASTTTMGSDLNVSYRNGPLMMGGGGSAYHYKSDASNLAGNLSTNAFAWSLRANSTWKFSPLLDAQIYANYRAPVKTEGGSQLASVFTNLGARYKVWGDQGNIALRFSDPFNLSKFGYRTANGTVVESSERYFGARAVFLTVTRNFGQALKLRPKSEESDTSSQPAPGGP
jgi:outer membrane receptor protein involved in Fe transport